MGSTLKQLNKNTDGVEKMLELIIGSIWLVLATYVVWYFFRAKTFQPLTFRRPRLNLETSQKTDRMHRITRQYHTCKKQQFYWIQV